MTRRLIISLCILLSLLLQASSIDFATFMDVDSGEGIFGSAMDNKHLGFKENLAATTTYMPYVVNKDNVSTELIYIPAGIFQMGCDLENPDEIDCTEYWVNGNELPLHTVFLDGYAIDKYEVTNFQYRACVSAGVCIKPKENFSYNRVAYFDNLLYDNYPVIYISWNDANDFCSWLDKRLPSEAEWEKAARGPNFSTQRYPWGNNDSDCKLANIKYDEKFGTCEMDTTEVGSYPLGESPYGVMDMAGNVWEFVNDWYQYDYYVESPYYDPLGPPEATEKVWRGGGFNAGWEDARVSRRAGISPNFRGNYIGFRCAK